MGPNKGGKKWVAGREKFDLDQPIGIAGSFLWLPLGFPTAQQ